MVLVIIDRNTVEHVAHLGRLELLPEEVERYAQQLSDILGYMEKLNELDTSGVEPMAHVLPLKNVWRDDLAFDCREVAGVDAREAALANAPASIAGMIKVPRVIEG